MPASLNADGSRNILTHRHTSNHINVHAHMHVQILLKFVLPHLFSMHGVTALYAVAVARPAGTPSK